MYGETPIQLWSVIARAAELSRDDLFLDLGCGRGKLCLWTSMTIGCSSIGVDWVPSFIRKARLTARLFRLPAQFFCSRITEAPISRASVIYLYTYHPDEEKMVFSHVPSGARVITVSEPLSLPDFTVSQVLTASFPWGTTEVFINKKLFMPRSV
jgi:SAM-dependent methyltransferase